MICQGSDQLFFLYLELRRPFETQVITQTRKRIIIYSETN